MADLGQLAKEGGFNIPNLASISTLLLWILGSILVLGTLAIGFYLWFSARKYNQTIIIFKKIGGKTYPYLQDKAKPVRISQAGDYLFLTRKTKKYLPRPEIEMSKNEFWFYERKDGEWINFGLQDIDKAQQEANAIFVDRDMRYARTGIQKNLDKRLQQMTFWQKWGNTILTILFIIIITVCLVTLFSNLDKIAKQLETTASAVEHLAKSVDLMMQRSTSGAIPINHTG